MKIPEDTPPFREGMGVGFNGRAGHKSRLFMM